MESSFKGSAPLGKFSYRSFAKLDSDDSLFFCLGLRFGFQRYSLLVTSFSLGSFFFSFVVKMH